MTTPETSRIEANAHGNNNIVWRRVNITGLSPAAPTATAELLVQNPGPGTANATVNIRPPDPNSAHSFLKFGEIEVPRGLELMSAWRRSDYRGTARTYASACRLASAWILRDERI